MKRRVNKYNIKRLKTNINIYGFKYSYLDFLIEMVVILVAVVCMALLSQLDFKHILVVIFVTLMSIPILISSWFEQMYNVKRFTMLCDYLNNALPIFSQKPKIGYTLNELREITSGRINKSINNAIYYLENTKNDPHLELNALKIIEEDFNNSRLKSVHRFMLNVESSDSLNYKQESDNLYNDIELWIKRTFTFQKELKDRRVKLVILIFMSLFMNLCFVNIYKMNSFFAGFTDSKIYQLSTTLFVCISILVINFVSSKLNGGWLVDDSIKENEKELKKIYSRYKNGYRKLKLTDFIFLLIFLILAALCVYSKLYYLIIYVFILFMIVMFQDRYKCKIAYKKISKHFVIEFPLWLRDVSLSLGNLTVVNAIAHSINHQSYPMRKEIRKLLDKINKNPTSIAPFNEFLDEYKIDDCKSSMRILYSLTNVSKKEVGIRVSNLNNRNQELLSKSESMRNADSLSGIEALGYLPMILVSIQMIVSMVTMFAYLMDKLRIDSIL